MSYYYNFNIKKWDLYSNGYSNGISHGDVLSGLLSKKNNIKEYMENKVLAVIDKREVIKQEQQQQEKQEQAYKNK